MSAEKTCETRAAGLEQAIERQIAQRTWGRVHRLQVQVVGDRIIVHGHTQSYHSKQLALEAVLDVIGAVGPGQIDLDIHVAASLPSVANRRVAARSVSP